MSIAGIRLYLTFFFSKNEEFILGPSDFIVQK